jgi:hypothetical protein
MGLPARQRRRLEGIENKLCSSDPRLAAMFTIFGRLTRDEEMPRIEELRHRAAVLALRIRLWLAAARSRLSPSRRRAGDPLAPRPQPARRAPSGQRAAAGDRSPSAARSRSGPRSRRPAGRPAGGRIGRWRPMAVFFPLALVLMSLSIFVAARFGSTPRCVATTAAATAKLNPKSKPLAKAGGDKASKASRRCRPAMLTPIPIGR